MGLDITAYSGLKKIDAVFDSDGEPIDPVTREYREDCVQFYENPDFTSRIEGVEHKAVYEYADSFGFRAGSYGWYNAWREELAKIAGYPAVPFERVAGYAPSTAMRHDAGAWGTDSGPFWELINFSDCEGTIGPVVAAKLAQDFANYQDKADASETPFFRERYADWRKAFDMAADGGAVDFH